MCEICEIWRYSGVSIVTDFLCCCGISIIDLSEQLNDSFEGGSNPKFLSCSKNYFNIVWKASRVQMLLRSLEFVILEKLPNMTPKKSDN